MTTRLAVLCAAGCLLVVLMCMSSCGPAPRPDASLHIYELSSGQNVSALKTERNLRTSAIALSPDGSVALTAGPSRELTLWSVGDRREIRRIPIGSPTTYLSAGYSLQFLKDTNLALVGHNNSGIHLWDLGSNALVRTFNTPFAEASTFVVSPDQNAVVAADALSTTAISWALASGERLGAFTEVRMPDSPYVTLALDGRPRSWWNSATGERRPEGEPAMTGTPPRSQGQAKLSPDGRKLLVYYGGVEQQPNVHWLRVWDLESGRLLWHRAGLTLPIIHADRWYSSCEALVFSPDSQLLAVGQRDGRIEVREVEGGRLRQELRSPPGSCERAVFLPDGKQLLTRGGQMMRLWNLDTGELVRSFSVPILTCFAVTPDGRFLLVGGTGQHPGL